ncbi:hypothetical protein PRK78_002773 [Emydomyces testavorans]|uniref:Uncharacterized protein n=1 Tax=Emydomyces testavorans TaxID=2070801 RepID=A0AAF0DFI8_9EURO|nr:hypothetical protein PRK78_002773 [Emydomyces testavorans]
MKIASVVLSLPALVAIVSSRHVPRPHPCVGNAGKSYCIGAPLMVKCLGMDAIEEVNCAEALIDVDPIGLKSDAKCKQFNLNHAECVLGDEQARTAYSMELTQLKGDNRKSSLKAEFGELIKKSMATGVVPIPPYYNGTILAPVDNAMTSNIPNGPHIVPQVKPRFANSTTLHPTPTGLPADSTTSEPAIETSIGSVDNGPSAASVNPVATTIVTRTKTHAHSPTATPNVSGHGQSMEGWILTIMVIAVSFWIAM